MFFIRNHSTGGLEPIDLEDNESLIVQLPTGSRVELSLTSRGLRLLSTDPVHVHPVNSFEILVHAN